MTTHRTSAIKGDRPLAASSQDELGFGKVASHIASALCDRASEAGLVVGLEGAWGSGKSSLLALLGEELEKLPAQHRPSVINFRPWLIGNRDALIGSLFSELGNELNRVTLAAGDATGVTSAAVLKATNALRGFMTGLGKAGDLISTVGKAAGSKSTALIGEGIKAAGKAVEGKFEGKPLAELKDKLAEALRELDHRFIITVDDVDRLEPAEAVEVSSP